MTRQIAIFGAVNLSDQIKNQGNLAERELQCLGTKDYVTTSFLNSTFDTLQAQSSRTVLRYGVKNDSQILFSNRFISIDMDI